jgi:predicted SAM-dependent methyltransferase
MSITLPFRGGDTVVELGGGERPLIKQIPGLKSINVDIRPLPEVDIIRDLEGDFSDIGQYDGVFANYLLEHVSWRKVPHFLEECYKILKPGGVAFFVVPDTYAQLQKVLTKKPEDITLEDSSFIFGGQDFTDNTHKWLISRPFLEKMLREAGFSEVRFTTHPAPDARDMFVEAYRGEAKMVEKEDKPQLRGVINVDYNYALPFKEGETIVELGGGDNPLRIDELNIVNVDARQLPTVNIVRNLEEGFADIGKFDGLFCSYALEHISWRNVERFVNDCYAILKPQTHAIFVIPDTYKQAGKITSKKPEDIDFSDSHMLFGVQEHGNDYHKWFTSRPLLEKMLKQAGFQSVVFTDSPDPKAADVYVDAYKSIEKNTEKQVKLNLGSFTVSFGHRWVNCDIRDDIKPALEAKGHIYEHCDVTQPFKWGDCTVDVITAHHLIEHLDRREGDLMLKECLRVLKSGGTIRLSTPDLERFIEMLPRFKLVYGNEYEVQHSEDDSDAFFRLAFSGHKTIYIYRTLSEKMARLGFADIQRVKAGQSRSNAILTETVDSFPDHSFYLEATKPDFVSQTETKPIITTGKQLQPYQRYLSGELEEGTQNAG